SERVEHSLSAAFWNFQLRGYGEGFSKQIWGVAIRHAGYFARVDELGAACGCTRSRCKEARYNRIIQREHLIFSGLIHEEPLQLFQLIGILRREVVVLGEVFGDVIEFLFL